MTPSRKIIAGLIGVFVVAVIAANTLYIVDQRKQAVVLSFGAPVRVVNGFQENDPGLKAKLPFVENVIYLDKRNQPLEADQEEVVASDQDRLIVDAFMRFRIYDPLQFYRTLGDEHTAADRLQRVLNSSLRQVLGSATSHDIIAGRREQLMQQTRADVTKQAKDAQLGIDVTDVRLSRVDLPQANEQAVFRRMETAREQQAAQIRSLGEQQKREIMAGADKEVSITRGTAIGQGYKTRGDGDAKRAAIYAAAYGKDPAFARLYRTLQAYDGALGRGDTTMVLSPQSAFFNDFEKGAGGGK